MSTSKQIRELKRAGYIIEYTNKQHIKVTHPTKPGTVFMPSTPGDYRGIKNTQAELRRKFGE